MRTSFLGAAWWTAAGAVLGCAAEAALRFRGVDVPRAFVLLLLGAGVAALPLGIVLLLGRIRPGPRGPFLAGLALAAAPALTALGLPMGVAAVPAWMAAVLLLRRAGGALRGAAGLRFLPVAGLLLLAAGVRLGGTAGPEPVVREFPAREGAAPRGPDVLLVSVDTLRADAVAGPHPPGFELPTLDRLRREGASAPYALSSSGLTLPGHLSMLTGLDSLAHGVRGNFDRVPAERLTFLSERFHEAGWRTAAVIANGLLARDIGFGDGFEVYDDSDVPRLGPVRAFLDRFEGRSWLRLVLNPHRMERVAGPLLFRALRSGNGLPERGRGARTAGLALDLLEPLLADERPYFFFLHFMDPHDPYGTVAPFDGTLTAGLPPLPAGMAPDPQHGISGHAAIALEEELRSGDPARAAAAAAPVDHLRLAYLEEVAYLDRRLGEVLARIEEAGRPTVVLFTGDHGEHFGEHGLMKHGNSLYEEMVRVPFLLRAPGVEPGSVLPGTPQLIDVAPTLLALAGLEELDGVQGRSWWRDGRLADPGERPHLAADDERFSLRLGARKWIGAWRVGGEHPVEALAFHDLAAAPAEDRNDLDAVPAEWWDAVLAELARDQHRAGAASEAQRFRAEELGYADGAD